MENDALKKKVLDVIRRHNLAISDDDPVTELAIVHQVIFEQHIERVAQLLDEQKHGHGQQNAALVEQCDGLFNALTAKLKGIRLTTQLPPRDRWRLNGLLILTILNSFGLIFILGKILRYF